MFVVAPELTSGYGAAAELVSQLQWRHRGRAHTQIEAEAEESGYMQHHPIPLLALLASPTQLLHLTRSMELVKRP